MRHGCFASDGAVDIDSLDSPVGGEPQSRLGAAGWLRLRTSTSTLMPPPPLPPVECISPHNQSHTNAALPKGVGVK